MGLLCLVDLLLSFFSRCRSGGISRLEIVLSSGWLLEGIVSFIKKDHKLFIFLCPFASHFFKGLPTLIKYLLSAGKSASSMETLDDNSKHEVSGAALYELFVTNFTMQLPATYINHLPTGLGTHCPTSNGCQGTTDGLWSLWDYMTGKIS